MILNWHEQHWNINCFFIFLGEYRQRAYTYVLKNWIFVFVWNHVITSEPHKTIDHD